MRRRTAYFAEFGLWMTALLCALLFGLLVAPGGGRELFKPVEPAKVEATECVAWTEIEQREVPTGRLLGVISYCAEYQDVTDIR
jgi:hypothetical protein